jgi:hypothetical protein
MPLHTVIQGLAAAAIASAEGKGTLPTIPFGDKRLSRLIVGANPLNGGSHLSCFVNIEMRAYYTDEQVVRTLLHCQEEGINCWQSGAGNLPWYRRLREAGGTMHFVSLGAGGDHAAGELAALKEAGCLGVAHHGEVTDVLFKEGRLHEMLPYFEAVREAGMMVGVSTHMPDVVDAVESAGWDVDFYMTCVYERHRSADELEALLGQVPLPDREVYLAGDPPRMYAAMRATRRPCLAFKILAAGRLSDRPEWVEAAFRETYASIKPTDAVIIGIYDRYTDQAAENAEYVRRFSRLSGALACAV